MSFFSASTSIQNMKTLAQVLFEISCTQDFQILFSKGHNSKKGHNLDMKKIWVKYFFMRNLYMKFHNPSFTIQKFQVDRKVEKKINEIFKIA